VQGTTSLHKQT